MLCKRFSSVTTSWLSRKSRHLINVYRSTLTDNSLPAVNRKKENVDTEAKKPIEETTTKVRKKRTRKINVLDYIEQSVIRNKEMLDLVNYIQKVNPDIMDVIRSMRYGTFRKGDANILHLIDKDTAARYVSLIGDDLSRNMCYVAELNPGFGVLTQELLKADVPLIHLYEGNAKLHKILETVCTKYPGRLSLMPFKNSNLFGVARTIYEDKINDEKMSRYQNRFKAIESKNWEDETYMQVIGASDSKDLFTFIISSLIFRNGFMCHGRPSFYIAILPSLWHRYDIDTRRINRKRYTYAKVMFQLMFNYEFLGTLNRKAFIPWAKRKYQHKSRQLVTPTLLPKQDVQDDQMYVIKLEPKADLYSQLSRKEWITFSYFVKHHMQARSNRVIPSLERWIPNCGIKLIAKDYTIYTQFGDLTPAQILELFKEFKSWPGYKESHFVGSMNSSVGAHNEPELFNE